MHQVYEQWRETRDGRERDREREREEEGDRERERRGEMSNNTYDEI